jgi:nicotinate-nucleotide pyrophosphorylase (carboxylating)
MSVKRFAVSIPEKIADKFEENLKGMDYRSRSMAVADALNRFTEKNLMSKDAEFGAMLIKGERKSATKKQLEALKSRHDKMILSSHRDTAKETFIEIWIVKGRAVELRKIKKRIAKVRGVVSCFLHSMKNAPMSCFVDSRRESQLNYKNELLTRMALEEDIGEGDITSENVVPDKARLSAVIRAQGPGILCGINCAGNKFHESGKKVQFEALKKEGSWIEKGEAVARIEGHARSILECYNTGLNLLMRLSGVATNTARFVQKLKPYKAKLLDTRRTIPDFREIEMYAIAVGGGQNRRMGLYDGVLVENHHVKIAGSVEEAVARAKKSCKSVSVEVRGLKQLAEALNAGAEHIMLKDMEPEDIRQAVRMADGKAMLEASGGINLENIEEIAKTGVDYVSVGSNLSLSAPALDFSLEIMKVE